MIHKVLLADAEFIPPTPPDAALELMPVTTESFGRDLWKLVLNALTAVQPEDPWYDEVRAVVKILNFVLEADVDDEIPPTSLVREFIGGNTFYRK